MRTVAIKDIIVLAVLATVGQAIQAPNAAEGSRQLGRRYVTGGNADTAGIFARDPKKGGGSSGGSSGDSSSGDDGDSGSSGGGSGGSLSCQTFQSSCNLGCMPSGMTCCLGSLDNEYCGATERCVLSLDDIGNFKCCPSSSLSATCNSTSTSALPASKGSDRSGSSGLSGAVSEKAPLATMGLLVIMGFIVWA